MSTTPPLSPGETAVDRTAGLVLPARVQAAMRAELPSVAQHAVAAIIDEVPSYAAARSFMVDTIEAAVRTALGGFLTLAARSHDPSTPLRPAQDASYELGRGEARNGRSLDALLAAYRVGARVSWRELSAVAVDTGLDAQLLAQFAELVFAYIDELSAASVSGHADELASAERLQQRERERLALDLLRGAPEDAVTRRAERAAWALPSELTVVLQTEEEVHTTRRLVDARSLALTEDLPGFTATDDVAALLVPTGGATDRRRLLRRLAERPCVVGPTVSWQEAHASHDRARRAWPAARATGAAYDTDAHLAELVLGADPAAHADLRRRALAPLDELTPASRAKLEETLRLWLLLRGRREAVADSLFVHPQTVRYRVGQLRELFGDALDDPDAVLQLVLSLGPPPRAA